MRCAGGHVVFLSTTPGNAHAWVCLSLERRLQGPELCGSKTHFSPDTSAVVQPEEIPALATACIMEVLVCWNAFIMTLCLSFSSPPLSSCFLHIHLSFSFHFPASSLSVPPSPRPFISDNCLNPAFNLVPILSLFLA